jgi:hypothetical protein
MRLVVNRPATVSGRFVINVKSRLATNIKSKPSSLCDSWQNKNVYARESNTYPAPAHVAKTAAVSASRNEKLSRRRLFLPSNI